MWKKAAGKQKCYSPNGKRCVVFALSLHFSSAIYAVHCWGYVTCMTFEFIFFKQKKKLMTFILFTI